MSTSNIIPGVDVTLLDGNLGVARPPSVGDTVLIIGTAEDGPHNQPIPITSTDQLTSIFGSFGQGTLVRGVYETMYATDSQVDVRAMRIGNGVPSTLGIKEMGAYDNNATNASSYNLRLAQASGVFDATYAVSGSITAFVDAVTLSANYNGSKYNGFTVRLGRDDNIGSDNYGKNCVLIYNPFTGVESSYSYDYYLPNNTAVQVHNVEELVDYINSDSNLAPYISAATTDLDAQFEIMASGTATSAPYLGEWYTPASGAAHWQDPGTTPVNLKEGSAITTEWNADGSVKKVTLQLHHMTVSRDGDGDGKPDCILPPEPEYGESTLVHVGPIGLTYAANIATGGNQTIELTKVYEVALASGELLSTIGRDFATLSNYPINRNDSVYPGSSETTIVSLNGNTKTSSQYRQKVVGGLVGISTDGTDTVFKFRAYLQPDFTSAGNSALPDIRNQSQYAYTDYMGRPITEAEYNIRSGPPNPAIKRLVSTGSTDMLTKVYQTIDGVISEVRAGITMSWDTATKEVTLTFTTAPTAGTIITIDYLSVAGDLTEKNTRTALDATRSAHNSLTAPSYQYYFVTGNEIYFGYPHETDIEVSYEYKREYSVPGDVSLSSSELGKIEFTNPSKQPYINRVGGARLGLQYTYRPEWITVTGVAAMGGGSNGTSMTTKQLKDSYTSAYEAIANYTYADIVVPMGAYLDDVYDEYSAETGIKRSVNAGFHTQLSTAMENMAGDTADVIGIIPVRMSTSSSVTDINSWCTRLTVTNSSDRTRGANYMAVFDAKRVQVVAADVAMSAARLGVRTVDYITTGATVYAGLIASLAAQMPATNKYIGRSLLAIRNKLSRKQQEAMIGARYVIFDDRPGMGIVAVKDVTAAAPGSDYNQLSTLRIAKMVADMVRSIGRGYLGGINSEQNRASLRSAINGALHGITSGPNQALRNYNLRVTSTLEDQRAGVIWVDIVLFPVFGINNIRVVIRLSNAE
jgi:hypothetical protein